MPRPAHFEDARLRIDKIVVGPYENNVFVLRDKSSGEGLIIDAANEHDLLIPVARAANVRRVLTTHGHWDHIQAVTAARDAGIDVGVGPADADMLPGYDFVVADEDVIEVGGLRLHALHTPGHTPGSVCFTLEGWPILFSGDTLFPGGPGATQSPPPSPRSSARSTTVSCPCRRTRSSCPATASTPPSARSAPTSANGRPGATERSPSSRRHGIRKTWSKKRRLSWFSAQHARWTRSRKSAALARILLLVRGPHPACFGTTRACAPRSDPFAAFVSALRSSPRCCSAPHRSPSRRLPVPPQHPPASWMGWWRTYQPRRDWPSRPMAGCSSPPKRGNFASSRAEPCFLLQRSLCNPNCVPMQRGACLG